MSRLTKILLVEGDASDARRVIDGLTARQAGQIEIRWVERLSDALCQLGREPFDIVLLDLVLPDSEGLETCRRLLEARPEIPVVVYTGIEDEAVALTAMHEGVEDYLVKSDASERILLRAIHYALERHRMRIELQNQSLTDDLTGLYNRRGFMTFASHHLRAAHRSTKAFCLLMADLDGLKIINDTHGHAHGDQAIREAAGILRRTFRSSDILARVGGDEFLVLALDLTGDAASELTRRLDRNLEEFNRAEKLPFPLSLSYGIVVAPPRESPCLEELLSDADRRMYEHKTTKRHTKSGATGKGPGPAPGQSPV